MHLEVGRIIHKDTNVIIVEPSIYEIHWDDDDYSAPERISVQVERLRVSGKPLTGFHTRLEGEVCRSSHDAGHRFVKFNLPISRHINFSKF
jgi:hypothetical protein